MSSQRNRMSESSLLIPEEVPSPDLFSDPDTATTESNHSNSDESILSTHMQEPEPSDDIPEWKGVSMDEIRRGQGIYNCHELPPISPSSSHTVLILLPLPAHGPPKPYPSRQVDKWSQGYVRMPYSAHSVYPVQQNEGKNHCRNRWEIIQESLLRSFVSSQQLEAAILSYNHIYAQRWDFRALHHFFSEVIKEEEATIFFKKLLPKMIQLALQLPVLITGPIPLLKRHSNKTISLSQLQVASLLANAFFCTFPRRNSTNPQSEYATYPYINFNRLYSAFNTDRPDRSKVVNEKLKCFFHYFRRVTAKAPEGVITIQRRYIPKQDCPKWDKLTKKLPLLHVTTEGTIETDGAGLLQVDFANKYLGGGVLGLGCVQEEIRFAICPELMVTMLVTEALDDTEALIISGIERYSRSEGYSSTFKWRGDYADETPRDVSKRRLTTIVAIDALYFKHPAPQFSLNNITRELNKAYVGFIGCDSNRNKLPAVATGNWGCGAFHGDPKLKVLIQLIAAAVADRSIVYFTFRDTKLRDDIAEMYWHLVQNNVDIGHLFSLLVQFQEVTSRDNSDLYRFLHNRSKAKPLSKYFSVAAETTDTNSTAKQSSTEEEFSWSKHIMFKKSKSFLIENRRTGQSVPNTTEEETEENRIERWLTMPEEDTAGNEGEDAVKKECLATKSLPDQYAQQNQSHVTEKKAKHPFWKSGENKVQSTTISERTSGLASLDIKQDLMSPQSDSVCEWINEVNVTSRTVLPTENIPDKIEVSEHVVSDKPTETIPETTLEKQELTVKKSNQRKISDFFQRAS